LEKLHHPIVLDGIAAERITEWPLDAVSIASLNGLGMRIGGVCRVIAERVDNE